jgi:aspartate/methionine/tyrosine aminotransferase
MYWAKARPSARFDLATSGVSPLALRDLGATLDDLELTGPSLYGYEPLQRALAGKCGVAPDCVVATVGASLAIHLAMAAVLEPGDEVLIEHPAYEPMVAVAAFLGAAVRRFERRREAGFKVDPEEVARHVTGRTRLIVLTHLHNPSGAETDEATLAGLGRIARRVGARVLVNEIYREMQWVESRRLGAEPGARPVGRRISTAGNPPVGERATAAAGRGARPALASAFHLGGEFLATGSLTKAYGLNGLRCGWILAEPELARSIWRLMDLFVVIPAHPAERLAVVALGQLERIADRAAALLERNRALLDRFLASRDELEVVRPRHGTILFPRLRAGDADAFCARLQEKYETAVVPGRFFGLPDHFRLGIGAETASLAAGLDRLGAALDELARR